MPHSQGYIMLLTWVSIRLSSEQRPSGDSRTVVSFVFPTPSTDNLPCHFVSAFGAGFVTTVIASPVDVVKTRYMNSPPGQYKSAINCAWTMMTKEGPSAFYKGWALPLWLQHTHSLVWEYLHLRSFDETFEGPVLAFVLHYQHLNLFVFVSCSFVPSFLRLGSWNVVMFVSFEQIKRAMMVTKKRIESTNWESFFTVWLKNYWTGLEHRWRNLKKRKSFVEKGILDNLPCILTLRWNDVHKKCSFIFIFIIFFIINPFQI